MKTTEKVSGQSSPKSKADSPVNAKKIWRRPQWRARNVRTHC